ncbi:hypothetical protein CsSME_00048553 [Camellia sinensis var. sinensis]
MSSTTNTTLKVTLTASTLKGNEIHKISRDGLMDLIRSIAQNQETHQPFYILDLGVVERLVHSWNHSFPAVKPFYVVKCNPNSALLEALASLGANFGCASQVEIETVLALGVSPDRILYANPCKAVSHIKYAASVGVNLTAFDSKSEIEKIKQWHPKYHTSYRPLGTKFGALPEKFVRLLNEAHMSGLKMVGVSFHVGSGESDFEIYRHAIAAAGAVFEAASQLQMPPMHGRGRGRFFVETAFTLVTNVIGKRVRGERREYWIDDGIYGSFNLSTYDRSSMAFKPLLLSDQSKDDEDGCGMLWPSTIFGPTCDGMDVVMTECKLPELQFNDLIVFYNMGAYSASTGAKFNGFDVQSIPTHLEYTSLS